MKHVAIFIAMWGTAPGSKLMQTMESVKDQSIFVDVSVEENVQQELFESGLGRNWHFYQPGVPFCNF